MLLLSDLLFPSLPHCRPFESFRFQVQCHLLMDTLHDLPILIQVVILNHTTSFVSFTILIIIIVFRFLFTVCFSIDSKLYSSFS